MQTCADVQAVIARVRSLFGGGEAIDVPSGAANISSAAQTVTTARSRIADLAGAGMTSYAEMADQSVPPLTTSAASDTAGDAPDDAAAVTQAGAARMEQISAQTNAIAAAAPMPKSTADERVILTALRSQVAQASQLVQATQQQASALAGQVRNLDYPKDAPGGGVQPLIITMPQSPAPGQDPPHGKDPRYWIDVTKIIHVPDGQLAPYNTTQIGPGLYYPSPDNPYFAMDPPPPRSGRWI